MQWSVTHSTSVFIQAKVKTITKKNKTRHCSTGPFSLKSWTYPSGTGQDRGSQLKPIFLVDYKLKSLEDIENTWKVNGSRQTVSGDEVKAWSGPGTRVRFLGLFSPASRLCPKGWWNHGLWSRHWQETLHMKPLVSTQRLGKGLLYWRI